MPIGAFWLREDGFEANRQMWATQYESNGRVNMIERSRRKVGIPVATTQVTIESQPKQTFSTLKMCQEIYGQHFNCSSPEPLYWTELMCGVCLQSSQRIQLQVHALMDNAHHLIQSAKRGADVPIEEPSE